MSDKKQASSKRQEQEPKRQQPQQVITSKQDQQHQPIEGKVKILIDHVKAHTVDVALWLINILTIIFAMSYILRIEATFNKVLLGNAAISVISMIPHFRTFSFSREFFAKFIVEDSCHYLYYSLLFFNAQPTFFILMPVVLLAILNASKYSLILLDVIGINFLDIFIINMHAVNILRAAAFSEIFVMPITIVSAFLERADLMTPVLYYHFLQMRYSSRCYRYTRDSFRYLRVLAENAAERSSPFFKNLIHKSIEFVNQMAPQPRHQPERQT